MTQTLTSFDKTWVFPPARVPFSQPQPQVSTPVRKDGQLGEAFAFTSLEGICCSTS